MAEEKFIRRPDYVSGELTAEEKQRMDKHASAWISNALRTDTVDRQALTAAIEDLYAAAGLAAPIVVVVPSPRIMAFAGGFAAAIWRLRENSEAATWAATWAATGAATRAATEAVFGLLAMEIFGPHSEFALSCAANWAN